MIFVFFFIILLRSLVNLLSSYYRIFPQRSNIILWIDDKNGRTEAIMISGERIVMMRNVKRLFILGRGNLYYGGYVVNDIILLLICNYKGVNSCGFISPFSVFLHFYLQSILQSFDYNPFLHCTRPNFI